MEAKIFFTETFVTSGTDLQNKCSSSIAENVIEAPKHVAEAQTTPTEKLDNSAKQEHLNLTLALPLSRSAMLESPVEAPAVTFPVVCIPETVVEDAGAEGAASANLPLSPMSPSPSVTQAGECSEKTDLERGQNEKQPTVPSKTVPSQTRPKRKFKIQRVLENQIGSNIQSKDHQNNGSSQHEPKSSVVSASACNAASDVSENSDSSPASSEVKLPEANDATPNSDDTESSDSGVGSTHSEQISHEENASHADDNTPSESHTPKTPLPMNGVSLLATEQIPATAQQIEN